MWLSGGLETVDLMVETKDELLTSTNVIVLVEVTLTGEVLGEVTVEDFRKNSGLPNTVLIVELINRWNAGEGTGGNGAKAQLIVRADELNRSNYRNSED